MALEAAIDCILPFLSRDFCCVCQDTSPVQAKKNYYQNIKQSLLLNEDIPPAKDGHTDSFIVCICAYICHDFTSYGFRF
jgi:hypothetical protein